jgi:polyisoprenoid-binding protein YceI
MTTHYETRPPSLEQTRWRLDPTRSTAEFRVRHGWGLVTVVGHFDEIRGTLDLRPDRQPAVDLTLHADSLSTGNAKRDLRLRSAAFFDVEHHPLVRFTSESALLSGETLTVRGDLEAAGRQMQLAFDAVVRRIGTVVAVEATTPADHRQLGMTWSPLGMLRAPARLTVRAQLVPDH